MTIQLTIFGISGRMGDYVLWASSDDDRFEVVNGTSSDPTPTPLEALVGANVAIDFSKPQGLKGNLDACVACKIPLVIGTTGLTQEHHDLILAASKDIPIVQAPNFSVGVTLMMDLVERASRVLGDMDAEIYERHHRHKKDAPSGTALGLGSAIMKGRGQTFSMADHGTLYGDGPRTPGTIGFAVSRAGDVAGDHRVSFEGENETIEIIHSAKHPIIFAHGALEAAHWLVNQKPGLYTMKDVLGL